MGIRAASRRRRLIKALKMSSPLLKATDLNSLLIFEKLCDDWVREVHKFTSERKKKKSFVIFRNSENKKLTSLDELDDVSFLENFEFKSAFSHDIVSNKVGANKIARKAAKAWMANPKAQISKPKTVKVEPVELQSLPVQEKCPVPKKVQEKEYIPESKEALPIKESSPVKHILVEESPKVETTETHVIKEDINAEEELTPVVENEKSPLIECEVEEEVIAPVATEVTETIPENAVTEKNEDPVVETEAEKEVTDVIEETVINTDLDTEKIKETSEGALVEEPV